MRTLPLAQIGPAKINVALRQVAEAPGIVAAKTLSAVYRNVFGLALTHEALTQNPANAATMPSKVSVGAQGRPERDTKRACTQAEEEALVAWVCPSPKGLRRDSSNTSRAMRELLEEAGFPVGTQPHVPQDSRHRAR